MLLNRKITITPGYYFTFWIGLSLFCFTLDYYHRLAFLRHTLNKFTDPIIYTVDQPIRAIKKVQGSLQEKNQVHQKIQALQEAQIKLQVKLNRYQVLAEENQVLRELLHDTSNLKEHYVTLAQLSNIKHSIKGSSEYCINRGARQGVKLGHVVLNAQGVIGQIIEVKANSSRLLNIDDPRSSIPVEVTRNRLRGVLKGIGSAQLCNVDYFHKTSDVQVDDTLVTSGIGGQYPKGYPVASITAVENHASYPYLKISAAPKAALATNQLFLILEIQEKS